jgi:hypothetical protein
MERPATRPPYSVLGSGRETPIRLPPWQRGLADYLARREQPESDEPGPRRSRASRRQPVLDLRNREPQESEDPEEPVAEENPGEDAA